MYLDSRKIVTHALFLAAILIHANPAVAGVEISDFFSDFTSSDVTFNSTMDFHGKAVFELLYAGSPVESHVVPLNVKAGETIYKVITWQKKPQYDYYIAKVSIYSGSRLLNSSSYQVSYRTESLPGFYVVDFSPNNKGVQFLFRPFNPSVADLKIELVDNNDVVYTKTKEDVSLTISIATNTEIDMAWPFLLTNNKNYLARAKIYTHRLYAPPLINTYIANFTATEDVEILRDDVTVDEYGASVTIRGKSQVPFDGFIVVKVRNRATNETQVFRQQVEDILVTEKEDTAGVVWKGLAPGTYDVEILAQDKENVTIDRYETGLRIPEYSNVSKAVSAKRTPGFGVLLSITMLVLAHILRSRR